MNDSGDHDDAGSIWPIEDPDLDPDRLVGCEYWRCGEIFEQRTANHRFCRKACRSRQHKWERAQLRKRRRAEARQRRRTT